MNPAFPLSEFASASSAVSRQEVRQGKVGLVFAGGGAKGAYQIGVVQALADANIRIDAVAGASIGALNGAIVAASPDLSAAAERLERVWRDVAAQVDISLDTVAKSVDDVDVSEVQSASLARVLELADSPVRSTKFLDDVLREAVIEDELRNGSSFWVSVFPSGTAELTDMPGGWFIDLVWTKFSKPEATWIHVNDRVREQMFGLILASAALPFALPAQVVNDRLLRDGGIADNAPAFPLVKFERCDIVFVVHLNGGKLWDASKFAPAHIIEIRPSSSLNPPGRLGLGFVAGLLDFTTDRVDVLILQGRRDTERVLKRTKDILGSVHGMRVSTKEMLRALEALEED